MHGSMGFWDTLLGEKKTLDLPQPDGSTKRVVVTKKWWDEMVRQGKIQDVTASIVRVNIIEEPPTPGDGATADQIHEALVAEYSVRSETWQIGVHVSKDQHDKFVDPESRELYAIRRHTKAGLSTTVIRRSNWEDGRRAMGLTVP